jgi:hypothetical protein
MSRTSAISLLLGALLLSAVPLSAGQAPGGSPPKSAKAAKDTRSAKQIDVCALLTSTEVEAVQGEPIKGTNPSEQHSSSFLMSQCFLSMATASKSVSLALAVPDPAQPSALTPREYWKKQFHPREQEEKEKHEPEASKTKTPKGAEEEREKELSKPRPVEGLGEEAYWVGNAITGALYVLQGDAFLRISVGGVREESARVEKSKALARAALKRL